VRTALTFTSTHGSLRKFPQKPGKFPLAAPDPAPKKNEVSNLG